MEEGGRENKEKGGRWVNVDPPKAARINLDLRSLGG